MHVPQLAVRVAEAGDQLPLPRSAAGSRPRARHAHDGREVEARFEWQAHEPIALREGVRPEAIEVVRAKGATAGLSPREQVVVEVVRSLYRSHGIPNELYQRALAEFSTAQLVELVVLAGHYGLLGFVLNGFKVDLPETAAPTF